jgi:MbtH protein
MNEAFYTVVCNDEGQYSVWPDGEAVPAGWRPVGFSSGRAACIDHIARMWTDLRPRSLREALEEA